MAARFCQRGYLPVYVRVNFLQLGRYGCYCEQRYRQQFGKSFDFMDFNSKMVKLHCSDRKVIAFDPSYIFKSGKPIPRVGYFWSGCAGSTKCGLETGGIVAIDLENHFVKVLPFQNDKTAAGIEAI